MSAEELRHGAGLQRLIRPVGPVPPDMPTATSPQRPAGPPAIVLPPGENEATRLHGLAALGTGRGVVGHTAHLNGATASSCFNCGECLTSSRCISHLLRWSAAVRRGLVRDLGDLVFAGQGLWARAPGGRRWSSLATVEQRRTAQGRPGLPLICPPGRRCRWLLWRSGAIALRFVELRVRSGETADPSGTRRLRPVHSRSSRRHGRQTVRVP